MAVDSSLFAADIPTGTYAVGDILPMVCVAGPANVRSGRGAAILKQIMCGTLIQFSGVAFRVHVKNSDWVDDCSSIAGGLNNIATLDDHSGLIQFGCDAALTENSGWNIFAECILGGTTTANNSIFSLIDIDYPSVSAVSNPDDLIGVPCSIDYDVAITTQATGTMTTASWAVKNVDYFKAGNQYCIQAVECVSSGTITGFVAFANAAGMGGLQRIIPMYNTSSTIRYKLRYASKLTKGPMDIKLMLFENTPTARTMFMVHDYVKRSA